MASQTKAQYSVIIAVRISMRLCLIPIDVAGLGRCKNKSWNWKFQRVRQDIEAKTTKKRAWPAGVAPEARQKTTFAKKAKMASAEAWGATMALTTGSGSRGKGTCTIFSLPHFAVAA